MNNIHDDDIVKNEENILVFNPYNHLNVEITLNDVQCILSKYGLPPIVYNFQLYRRAFIHRSYTKRPNYENIIANIKIEKKPDNCLSLSTKSNERLEFLGDGILEAITKYYLYRRFPKENEGFMTEKKIAIVKNENIGKIALEMGLHKWLILSRNAEEKKIRTNLKKLGCLFEAFIGSLFLDFNKIIIRDEENWFSDVFVTGPGFQMAQKFIENVFETHIDWVELITSDNNYKNILQVRIQKEFKVTPNYLELQHNNEDGYFMGVYLCLGSPIYNYNIEESLNICEIINNNNLLSYENILNYIQNYIKLNDGKIFIFLGKGHHKIKRKAEQIACYEALKSLYLI